jgi:hypothetical protein
MIEGVEQSKRQATVCAFALGLTAAMVCVHREVATEWDRRLRRMDDSGTGIEKQIALRKNYEDSDLAALRARVNHFRSLSGPAGTFEFLLKTLGNDWAVESGPKVERDGFSVQLCTFWMHTPNLADWQKAIGILGILEGVPGVGIAGFKMKTSGDREHRKVEILEIIVEVRSCHPANSL